MSKTLREHCEKAVADGVDGLYVRPESALQALDDAVKAERERVLATIKASLITEVRLACDLADAKVVLVHDVQEALDWARGQPLTQATEPTPEGG